MIVAFENEIKRIADEIGIEYQTKRMVNLEDFIQNFALDVPLMNSVPITNYTSSIDISGAMIYTGEFKLQFITKYVKSDDYEATKNILIDDMISAAELFFRRLNQNDMLLFGNVPFSMRNEIIRNYTSNACVCVQCNISFNTACNRIN
jgi:hypothetical protein